jgi:hypothetical protein
MKIYQKGKYVGENHITDDELNGCLKDIREKVGPKGFVYVVIDACHAGSSYRGDEDEDSIITRERIWVLVCQISNMSHELISEVK